MTTTEYGSFGDHADADTPESLVRAYLGEHAHAFDVPAIVAAFRRDLAAELPDGVSLAGRDFYGPYPRPCGASTAIRAAVERVDLAAIVRAAA